MKYPGLRDLGITRFNDTETIKTMNIGMRRWNLSSTSLRSGGMLSAVDKRSRISIMKQTPPAINGLSRRRLAGRLCIRAADCVGSFRDLSWGAPRAREALRGVGCEGAGEPGDDDRRACP
jgi:hypothetical protein